MYTLGDIIRKSALLFPDNIATVFESTRLTYRELNARVNRLANALVALGLGKSDRLTVLAENTHKYLEIYFAASKIGICVTPLNFRLSDKELVQIINDSEANCLFAADGYEDRVMKIKPDLINIKHWISLDTCPAIGSMKTFSKSSPMNRERTPMKIPAS
jgi:acyl-CoA synthetase (AMP-forming)/AMP-acid ligase II